MSVIDSLAEYLRSLGYDVDVSGGLIRIRHGSLPIYLYIDFRDRLVYMGINYEDNLRDLLEDLYENGEDIENIVEDAVGYLNVASLKVRQWIEDRGFVPVFKLRDGSIEIYEMVEEIVEEGGL